MKVLITPRSFGKLNPELFDRLASAGLEIIRNDTGGILDKETLCRMIGPCEGVILGVDPFGAEALECAPKLRAISRYGVGMDNIDEEACAKRGIKVSRTVGANSDAVADYAMALMLAVARRIVEVDRQCRQHNWTKLTTLDLYGKTLGIIGLGAIGRRVAKRAKGFEMRILGCDINWDEQLAQTLEIERSDVANMCRVADVITLHCGLDESTRNIIDKPELALMKSSAILVNTARGGLINEKALLEALKNRTIYGAGIDVFETEPPEDPEWYTLDNLIMGSHCAASSQSAIERMGEMSVDNLLRDLGLEG